LNAIKEFCYEKNLKITIVLGPGYRNYEKIKLSIENLNANIKVVKKTKTISDYMSKADIALTSGGRTVLELCAMNVPTIVMCQNQRELTHTFASSENGIVNLGLGEKLDEREILDVFSKIFSDNKIRLSMYEKMVKMDLTNGKQKVIGLISDLLVKS
jgi:spore coat polysaccharide biosynthesis predicted glycosyltransferase SpsG